MTSEEEEAIAAETRFWSRQVTVTATVLPSQAVRFEFAELPGYGSVSARTVTSDFSAELPHVRSHSSHNARVRLMDIQTTSSFPW